MALCNSCRHWFADALDKCLISEIGKSLPYITFEDFEKYRPPKENASPDDMTTTEWSGDWPERDFEFDRKLDPMLRERTGCWMCCWFCIRYETIKSHSPDELSAVRDDQNLGMSKTLRPLVTLDENGDRLLAITIRLSFGTMVLTTPEARVRMWINLLPNGDTYFFQLTASFGRHSKDADVFTGTCREIYTYRWVHQDGNNADLMALGKIAPETINSESLTNKHLFCDTNSLLCRCRVQTISEWLQTCLAEHPACRTIARKPPSEPASRAFLPTRLIAVGERPDEARLIETNTIPTDREVRYATLSHCWGTKRLLTLTEANHHALLESVPVNELGKTFRQALEVCYDLFIEYIWIDCLCIIQDSRVDWRKEASRMHYVYGNSLINLSATASRDCEGGLLQPNSDVLRDSIQVKLPNGVVLHQEFSVSGPSRIESYSQCPLLRRGWILQECFLSPRVLHCTQAQLIWQCKQLATSEIDELQIAPDGMGQLNVRSQRYFYYDTFYATQSIRQLDEMWFQLAKDFAETSVTKPEDKYYALAGLARLLQERYEDAGLDTKYVAGLWSHNWSRLLAWNQSFPEEEDTSRVAVHFPSWSWLKASRPTFDLNVEKDARNLEIHGVAVGTEPHGLEWGPDRSAQLHVVGCQFTFERIGHPDGRESKKALRLHSSKEHQARSADFQGHGLNGSWIHFDRADDAAKGTADLCVIISVSELRRNSENAESYGSLSVQALMLEPTGEDFDGDECYRRVGFFRISLDTRWSADEFDTFVGFFSRENLSRKRLWLG